MKPFEVIRTYHIRPRKRLGQNFLIDKHIRDKLCAALPTTTTDYMVEIGAGFGIVTECLAQQCAHLWAIECDKNLCSILQQEVGDKFAHITIVQDSLLRVPLDQLVQGKKIHVIGNLPYYITSKILFYLVMYRTLITSAILTVQKEVAERLLALPGTKQYGRLTVSFRYFADVKRLFEIKPTSFYPAPQVTSVVINVVFRNTHRENIDEALFLDVVEALFQERRKTVRNSLCLLKRQSITKERAQEILTACHIDPTKRAEELIFKDFIALTRYIENR